MGKPYGLPLRVATVLAHLCCFRRRLPQGAPTSPVISNMISSQMDSELQHLARICHSTYTRYADDITFSTTNRRFPSPIAYVNELEQVEPGTKLTEIVKNNGFSINRSKVWLRGGHVRQIVTGVTVNEFPNVPHRFTNQIRAMLYAWKKFGLDAAQDIWAEQHYAKHRAPWRTSPPPFDQVLKGKIEYLGMIKGQESHTYLKFLDQLGDLNPKLAQGRGTPLKLLLKSYDSLGKESIRFRERGYRLEGIMNGLFDLSGISASQPFRRNAGGEQIDGAFELDNRYYLVECKWRGKKSSPAELDALLGKVRRTGGHSHGVFVSVNGWSRNVVNLLKQDIAKTTILMNGEDLHAVLRGEVLLQDMIRAKVEALSLRAEPFYGWEDIRRSHNP